MPFITKEKRLLVDKDVRFAEVPGDLTYYFYRQFMNEWAKEKRWSTAHTLYKKYLVQTDHLQALKQTKWSNHDVITALHLAWQVFFSMHVMEYEVEKEAENGEIV